MVPSLIRIERFSPSLTLLTLVLFSALMSLGFWQLDRAEQKRELIRVYSERLVEPAIPLAEVLADWQKHLYRRVVFRGHFLENKQVLLENQVRKGRAGVHDYRVFKTEDGILLLINLGWHETLGPYAAPIHGQITIKGLMRPPPEVGLRLGDLDTIPFRALLRTPYLDIDWISGRFEITLEPFVVLLEDETTEADEWMPIHFPPEKHQGYALTWFSLAATLLILFGFYTFSKQPTDKKSS
jgi:surfeit locus 1 family protein